MKKLFKPEEDELCSSVIAGTNTQDDDEVSQEELNSIMESFREEENSKGGYREKFFGIYKKLHSGDEVLAAEGREEAIELLSGYVWHIYFKRFSKFYKLEEELISEGFVAILDHLMEYDPAIAAPSTFFVRHIHHNMYLWLQWNFHITPHYQKNRILIEEAVQRLKQNGKSPSVANISIETGLRESTIIRTNYVVTQATQRVPLDAPGVYNFGSTSETPEKIVMERETYRVLNDVLAEGFTEMERELLMLHGGEMIPYKKLTKIFNMTESELKKLYNSMLGKLREDKRIQSIGSVKKKKASPYVPFMECDHIPMDNLTKNVVRILSKEEGEIELS